MASASSLFVNSTQQLSSMFSGAVFQTDSLEEYPAVYTGVIVLGTVPLFFFLKKTTMREKIAMGALIVLMVLSFNLPFFDYVWHGFRYPTNYPFLEAFLFSIILIIITHRVLIDIKDFSAKALFSFAFGAVIIGVCSAVELQKGSADAAVSLPDVCVTSALFLLFCGFIALLRFGKKEQKAAAIAFLFILTIGDGAYTYVSNLYLVNGMETLSDNGKDNIDRLLAKTNSDSLFYRTEIVPARFINDGAFFDFNSVRQSSSMAAPDVLKFMDVLGGRFKSIHFC